MAKLHTVGVFTSGGDSPGMNAALRAVVRTAYHYSLTCYGIYNGYDGLIRGEVKEISPRDVGQIIHLGGTILGSARSKEFYTAEGRKEAANTCSTYGIDALVCIGGDGSFTGANILYAEHGIQCIGIPGTIDNDIFGTDFTIGYDTALNTVMQAVDRIRDTATSHHRLFFVEVMGRDAGFIALNGGIASGAVEILIPEYEDTLSGLFQTLERSRKAGRKSSIVLVAEGEEIGGAEHLAKITREHLPEYDIRVSILGHIQRGGSPSCADRVLASRLGYGAIKGLVEGRTAEMVGIRDHQLVYTPFTEAIKKRHYPDEELLKLARVLAI